MISLIANENVAETGAEATGLSLKGNIVFKVFLSALIQFHHLFKIYDRLLKIVPTKFSRKWIEVMLIRVRPTTTSKI